MGARHDVPLETVEGIRTTASSGERILLGLALIALLGGAMIGFSNLLGLNLEATATDTPRPTIDGSPTPRPTASPRPPREFVLDTTPDTTPNPGAEPFDGGESYWIRALVDLPVYGSTRPNATPVATIVAGAAAFGYDYPTEDPEHAWFLLQAPHGGYWIPTRADGQELVRRYQGSSVGSGWVGSVAAGPNGFLAAVETGSTDGSDARSLLLSSTDGSSWAVSASLEDAYGDGSAAWGPAGWIRVTSGFGESTQLHRSDDGVSWEPLGRVPDRYGYLCCFSLHGSDFGYLMVDGQESGGWFSVDGVAWRQMGPLPNVRRHTVQIVATPSGFFAWLAEWDWRYEDVVGVAAAFSGDGRTWVVVDGGPSGYQPRVVQVGERLVGVDAARVRGASRAWVGRFDGTGVAWEQAPGDAFGGGEITALVSDGHAAYAFGLRAVSGEPTVWVGDGIAWEAEALPASFEGRPEQAAAGPTGVTVVGSRPNARGDNPIFWHRTDAGSWHAERDPVIDLVPERPRDCGELPSDIVGLMTADTIGLGICFDDAPITIRAWMVRCPWGCDAEPFVEPWWLYSDRWMLAPITSVDWGAVSLAIPPSIAERPEWDRAWVEVTGHFRDPAAATCRFVGPGEAWDSEESFVYSCGQRFVAESITLVDGP